MHPPGQTCRSQTRLPGVAGAVKERAGWRPGNRRLATSGTAAGWPASPLEVALCRASSPVMTVRPGSSWTRCSWTRAKSRISSEEKWVAADAGSATALSTAAGAGAACTVTARKPRPARVFKFRSCSGWRHNRRLAPQCASPKGGATCSASACCSTRWHAM